MQSTPTSAETPPDFAGVLAWQARKRPQALAVRTLSGAVPLDLSYLQLHQRSQRMAAWAWHVAGVRAGDRVAWLGLNHPDQLSLLFALAQIGAALVPLNHRLAPAEWQAQLAQCTPRLLLCEAPWQAQAQPVAHALEMPLYDTQAPTQNPVPNNAPRIGDGGQAPCLLVYTSGTTGASKAAAHTQANLWANMQSASAAQCFSATDIVASMLPMFHVGGLCIQTLPALLVGASLRLLPRFEAGAALACFAHERPTLTLQVPATLQALIAHPQWPATPLASLRAVWAGSSLLPRAYLDAFHARGVPLCNVYGATETGPFSIALPPEAAASHVGSCGWPAPSVEAKLVDVAQGVSEVCLRGPAVVTHYWPDIPALDEDGWFHSGDLAQQAPDGSYTIVGRAKDMVISGGENIYPAEVEQALARHSAVAECAVLGVQDARWGEALVAAVVLHPNAALSLPEVHAHLAPLLARYKWPRRLVCVAELPKTALGKVQKAGLAQLLTVA